VSDSTVPAYNRISQSRREASHFTWLASRAFEVQAELISKSVDHYHLSGIVTRAGGLGRVFATSGSGPRRRSGPGDLVVGTGNVPRLFREGHRERTCDQCHQSAQANVIYALS
jgi:hypothetical protein